MNIHLNLQSLDDYRLFLAAKRLPRYSLTGRILEFPDEYATRLGLGQVKYHPVTYRPSPFLFDYQRAIAGIAIKKRKYSIFADCGLGKTLIYAEWARHVLNQLRSDQCLMWICPLMVIEQTIDELRRFYGDDQLPEIIPARNLQRWLNGGGRFGITNYDGLKDDLQPGRLGAMICDESSMLKSHYGKWGTKIIDLGKGINWTLAGTGTPAPNDRIEYANHAVLMDQFPTVNAFLATYFVNRGQTNERWEIKQHAVPAFFRALSHWCIFLRDPKTYGWHDNTEHLPEIIVRIHDVDLTSEQHAAVGKESGELFASRFGGITSRATLARIAKGRHRGVDVATNKPKAILNLVESFQGASTIIWCKYNDEQETIAAMLPDAANISGDTPHEERMRLIDDFKSGRRTVMISKPKILGFGLNLQVCTRMIFSTLEDSYESYYQAVKRANRYGSTEPLEVHIPATDLEMPMIDNVLRKARNIQSDTEAQERLFHEHCI